ncbi:MAG: hypothetical protein KatS3mg014_1721 [Actinomycetota bacterium]|nr:MAG: hypothetical protein KatS3mg014_1721 [Actinomycetota bacterium]
MRGPARRGRDVAGASGTARAGCRSTRCAPKIDYGTAEAKTTFGRDRRQGLGLPGDEIPAAEQETERLRARALAQATSAAGASTGALIDNPVEAEELEAEAEPIVPVVPVEPELEAEAGAEPDAGGSSEEGEA